MANYFVSPATYIVELRDQYGRFLVAFARPQQKQFSVYRNKPGSAQFVLDLYDPQAIPQYLQNSIYDIVFRRNSVPVVAGQMTYHEPKVDDSDSQKEVDITATGYFDQLDYRIVTNDYPGFDAIHNQLPYPPTDVGQIAWSLINYAQFPVPGADDTTASTIVMTGLYSVYQSFQSPGTSTVQKLKFVMQNGSVFTGSVSSASGSTSSFAGTAQSGTSNTITDSNQPWGLTNLDGGTITITSGTDAGDTRDILSTSGGTITVSSNWTTTPDSTSTYSVSPSITIPGTLTDLAQNWIPNSLAGGSVTITNGTDAGDTEVILSNTSNTITLYGSASSWDGTATSAGTTQIVESFTGTATSGTSNTLTDTDQPWGLANLGEGSITITGGTGLGQTRTIQSSTGAIITVTTNWSTTPDDTSTYSVQTSLVNGATVGTLTDTNQTGWASAYILGGTITINGGTDAGDSQTIIAISGDTITVGENWQTLPDTTSTYTITTSIGNGIQSEIPSNPLVAESALIDTNQDWLVNALVGQTISITSGTDNGDAATIVSNTATQINIEGQWQVNPDLTSTYMVTPGLSGQWALTPDTTSTYSIIPATPLTVGNVIVQIVNDLNGTPKGSVVPNSIKTIPFSDIQITVATVQNALGWFEIDYSSANVSLIQGQQYWLSISLDTVQSEGSGLTLQVLSGNYYLNGQATSLQNPTLFVQGQDIQFFVLLNDNSYQMTKNTYNSIQLGTIQPSFRLSPTFDQYKHIKAAIEDLSTTYNGIDFAINVSIDPNTNYLTKTFNVYYPGVGMDNTSLNFSYPGNIKKLEKPKDGTQMYNEVWMRGQGSGTAQIVATERDNTSIFIYGLRQVDESQPDVSDLPTLTGLAQQFISLNKDPSDLPAIYLDGNLPPALGSYGIGDQINIVANDPRAPALNFTNTYRIEEIDVTIDDDGVETIEIQGDNVLAGYNLSTSGGGG